jgi:hypothetical protein
MANSIEFTTVWLEEEEEKKRVLFGSTGASFMYLSFLFPSESPV